MAIIGFAIVGTSGQIEGDLTYSIIKVIPYIGVLIAAVAGANVMAVLIGGIIFAGIVGIMAGSMTPPITFSNRLQVVWME